MSMRLSRILYRLRQVRQQLGFVAPLSIEERAEVAPWLPTAGMELFSTMSPADQRHALRVWQGLQFRGCTDKDLLAAALLHDVGKAQGRVPFWTRPVIVLAKLCAPRLLARLAVYPHKDNLHNQSRVDFIGWRRSLGYAWWHAEVGAKLAADAGLSERAVLYIRTHHLPNGPAAELHMVDEVS